MRNVEFIPAKWVEQACWTPGLVVYSRTIQVERRVNERSQDNLEIENLLMTHLGDLL